MSKQLQKVSQPEPRDLKRELAQAQQQLMKAEAELAEEQSYRTSLMAAVNAAYTSGDTQATYDLAGELDPAEVEELANIKTPARSRLYSYFSFSKSGSE